MAKTTLGGVKEDAKKSASKTAEKTEVAPVAEENEGSLVPAAEGGSEVAKASEQLQAAGLRGDFNQSDINLPRLNIVAKTSQLVDEGFTPGSIILNKEVTLSLKDEPLRVIVLDLVKQFQEDTEWGGDELPKVFNTEEEVYAAGMSLEWGSPNQCRPMAHITMLIEAPEGLDENQLEMFPYEFDGGHWAMAILTAAKSAYKSTAKEIATFAAFSGANGIWTAAWNLTSKLQTSGDNSWFSPVMKRAGRIDAKLLAFVEGVK